MGASLKKRIQIARTPANRWFSPQVEYFKRAKISSGPLMSEGRISPHPASQKIGTNEPVTADDRLFLERSSHRPDQIGNLIASLLQSESKQFRRKN